MAIIYTKKKKKPASGHAKPLPFIGDINQPGRLRVGHLQTLLSLSHSGVYARIEKGEVPKPDGKDGKRPYWFTETIRPLVTKQ